MYIAIEGLKGSGKSTLLERLPSSLQVFGLQAEMLCPTRSLGEGHPLEHAWASSQSDDAREQLYAARSNVRAAQTDWDAPLILGDRSILTSYATRWERFSYAERIRGIDLVDALEWRIRRPDHVLFLDVPLSDLLARLGARTERSYGRQDETPARLASAHSAYLEMQERAEELGLHGIRWHRIDARGTPQQVLAITVQLILSLCRGISRAA